MDRQRMIFCPDMGNLTRRNMASSLATRVFGDEGFANLLAARYDQMGHLFRDAAYDDAKWNLDAFGCDNVADDSKKDDRLKVPRGLVTGNANNLNVTRLFDYDNFGHDMPIWVSYNNDPNAKRVMIISQDPLRGRDNQPDANGYLYLSTPFGVHSRDFEEHMDPRVRDMLNTFLEADFCVCLTDYMKFYATDTNGNKIVQDDVTANRNGYKGRFSKVVDYEIDDAFDPQLIITFGMRTRGSEWTDSVLSSVQHPRQGMAPRPLQGNARRKTMTLVHPSNANVSIARWRLAPAGPGCVIRYFNDATVRAIECLNSANPILD